MQGCEREKEKEVRDTFNIKIDKELDAISPLLALMKVNINVQKQINCVIGKALTEGGRQQNESSEESSESLGNESMQKCDFYSEIERITNKTFDAIKNNKSLMVGSYYFEVFEVSAEKDYLYRKIEIGLFKSLGDCKHFESRARDIRLPTRACQLWEGSRIK